MIRPAYVKHQAITRKERKKKTLIPHCVHQTDLVHKRYYLLSNCTQLNTFDGKRTQKPTPICYATDADCTLFLSIPFCAVAILESLSWLEHRMVFFCVRHTQCCCLRMYIYVREVRFGCVHWLYILVRVCVWKGTQASRNGAGEKWRERVRKTTQRVRRALWTFVAVYAAAYVFGLYNKG